MIPHHIYSLNVKVDAEGADLQVLKSGGQYLSRIDTIGIECSSSMSNRSLREGECKSHEPASFMEQKGFTVTSRDQGDLVNMFFVNQQRDGNKGKTFMLPPLLRSPSLTFQMFYNELITSQ